MYQKIDLYNFLLYGDQSGNVLLNENDLINIPVYQKRVTISGEVKRPGIYEMLEGENMEKLISFAAGFTAKAYTASIKVQQITDKQRRIKDIPKQEFNAYNPQNGDEFTVGSILEKFENNVSISGAVYRPGQYELTSGLTVGSLIRKADGVKGDVFLDRGLIQRTNDDQTKETIAFNLKGILNGSEKDILLKNEDIINIASIFDFKDQQSVSIGGEVRKPGSFQYNDSLKFSDILFQAGGFTEAGSAYHIEIARRVNKDNFSPVSDNVIAEVFDISGDRDLSVKADYFKLKPFDVITVRKKPGFFIQKTISVVGEVLYPGPYTIQSKTDRVSDLLKRSGGTTPAAYMEGISLIRKNNTSSVLGIQKIDVAKNYQRSISDTSSSAIEDIINPVTRISINMKEVIQNPGSKEDLVLEEGDILDVPKNDMLVKISGEVYLPTKVGFMENFKLKEYLNRAGGVTDNARRSRVYVIQANGQIEKTKPGLFGLFRSYPGVFAGSEIVVPKRREKARVTGTEIIGSASILLSMAGVIIAILNSLK